MNVNSNIFLYKKTRGQDYKSYLTKLLIFIGESDENDEEDEEIYTGFTRSNKIRS